MIRLNLFANAFAIYPTRFHIKHVMYGGIVFTGIPSPAIPVVPAALDVVPLTVNACVWDPLLIAVQLAEKE